MSAPLDPFCLFQVLADHRVEYVLIGGMAAVLHGSTVLTNDADIVPDPDPDNVKRLSGALVDLAARIRSDATPDGIPFEPHPTLLASMAMLNTTTRCGDLDLSFNPPGMVGYADLAQASNVFEIDGLKVRVAALADIIRSKEVADRPKDRAVLPILYALADEIERRSG
jgi:hypothetical protein